MAQSLHWIPDTLYTYSLSTVVNNYESYKKEFKFFHGTIIFDIFYKLYTDGHLACLNKELVILSNFNKVLDVTDKRYLLHNCFQTLEDQGFKIALNLALGFEAESKKCIELPNLVLDKLFSLGFSLGIFLCDAGWFKESEIVFQSCLHLYYSHKKTDLCLLKNCLQRVLRAQTNYCKFLEGSVTVKDLIDCINKIKSQKLKINLAGAYSEISAYYLSQSDFKEPYHWSIKALKELNASSSPAEIVYTLRYAAKTCLVKMQFRQAEWLIKQALMIARDHIINKVLMMSEVLIDYGYHLMHMDSTLHSIQVYKEALNILSSVLGGKNLRVAQAREDYAYALYVSEYSTGNFGDALDHAKKALSTKLLLLKEDHLLLFSAKRVNALILEEIAIDSYDKASQEKLYAEAEELHISALQITLKWLGKMNVQTGKHYGNLGRLYQSMNRFEEAEKMHLKGISIKQEILGPNDKEVASAMGHLASLYSYDMEQYEKAETLYQKSIQIGLYHFGKSYSGLEFDYRGLIRVYNRQNDWMQAAKVHLDLHEWKILRDENQKTEENISPLSFQILTVPCENIFIYFETLHTEQPTDM